MRYIQGALFTLVLLTTFVTFPAVCHAKTAKEIDASIDSALVKFDKEVPNAKELLKKAKGVLIIPGVIKAGFVLGGEYGVGALQVNGKTVQYYNTAGGSFGFQIGGQVKNIYMLFMEEDSLKKFRESDGWKAGTDGSVAFMKKGVDSSGDTMMMNKPILGFVLGQKGLMVNLTFEGAKFNKIKPEEK